jgi:DNA primase
VEGDSTKGIRFRVATARFLCRDYAQWMFVSFSKIDMALPVDFSQQVKSSADIVRIIGEQVRLKKAGANFVGLCPFHQEKSPSFSVHASKQFYYCFGCGAKGDVFRFVMETEKLPFPEAVRRVAQKCGIPIPAPAITPEMVTPERKFRATLEEIHQKAYSFFRSQLQTTDAASVRELIQKRGVTPESTEFFGLGYAPGGGQSLTNYLSQQKYSSEVLEACGLLIHREQGGFYDRFRNRWIFPILGEHGKVVAFAGRALGDDQPKYLNSPETALYTKSKVLYNLFRAREAVRDKGTAVIVEGYMDAIAVFQAGIKNVVASCGTSLTEHQVRMLSRFAGEVVVSYDPDSAGVAATDRSITMLLEQGLSVRVLRLPAGMDPDQFIQKNGVDAYRSHMDHAQPFFRYLAGRALELHGKGTPEAKLAAMNFVLPYLAKVPNQLIRSELVADIAQKLDVGAGLIMDAFRRAGLERREVLESSREFRRIPSAEAMLIRLLMEDGESHKALALELEERGVLDEFETSGVVSGILSMIRSGTAPDLNLLSDRLEESDQRKLAQIVFDKEARPVSSSEINAYINTLERQRFERKKLALRRLLAEAEKSGDVKRAVELLVEQRELDKEMVKLL